MKKGPRRIQIRQLLNNQLEHVQKGCLSDPPSDIIKIHRVNPKTKEVKTARGTGGCENDHRWLNDLLEAPSVGIARAERVIDDFYEMSNDRKLVNRLGMKEQPTYRTDKLLFLNSLARSCGFDDAQLPFEVSYPPPPPLEEYMGLNFELPQEFRLPPKEQEGTSDIAHFQFSSTEEEDPNEEETISDMASFLEGMAFDEDDVPVEGNQFTPRDETETEEEIITRLEEESSGLAEELEPAAFTKFETEVASALPRVLDGESTMEAWQRLTQQRPIIPFKNPRLPLTALDKAECALFDELQVNYNRHSAYLGGVRGYKRFEVEWNNEVANRCREKLTTLDGMGEDVQLVHRKTHLHLREHHDNLESQKRTASLAGTSDGAINRLHFQLRDTRREMAPHQEAHDCQPITYDYRNGYVAPIGNPTTLNANITANAFTHNQ